MLFFAEHWLEWFSDPRALPPPSVWLGQALHLALLVGYLIALKWEVVGSVVIVLGAGAFFVYTLGWNFYAFFTISILPAILYVLAWWMVKTRNPREPEAAWNRHPERSQ